MKGVSGWALWSHVVQWSRAQDLRWGLFEEDGIRPLWIMSDEALDPGTLPEAARTAAQYFRPQPGDTILISDPSAGANHFQEVTLVSCLRLSRDRNVLVALRADRGSSLQPGQPFPPFPVAQAGVLNDAFVAHLPEDFRLRERLTQLDTLGRWLKEALSGNAWMVWRETLERDLQKSRADWSQRDLRHNWRLASGETLDLHLDQADGFINFDFGGSGSSELGGWTSSMALGLGLSACRDVLGWLTPSFVHAERVRLQTKPGSVWAQTRPSPVSMLWAHPLAWQARDEVNQLLAQWLAVPYKRRTPASCFLEFHRAGGVENQWLFNFSGIENPWDACMRLASTTGAGKSWRRSELTHTRAEGGDLVTEGVYEAREDGCVSFWLSEPKRDEFTLISTTGKSERLAASATGRLELRSGEKLRVRLG